jgi:hypothetical protein
VERRPALPADASELGWNPKADHEPKGIKYAIFPYLGNDGFALSSFTMAFTFEIPLNKLTQLKRVRATISSHNTLRKAD